MATIQDALTSMQQTMAFDPRDWSVNDNDAWLYGIVCGWGTSLPEVARRHNWKPDAVARLKRLRAAVVEANS